MTTVADIRETVYRHTRVPTYVEIHRGGRDVSLSYRGWHWRQHLQPALRHGANSQAGHQELVAWLERMDWFWRGLRAHHRAEKYQQKLTTARYWRSPEGRCKRLAAQADVDEHGTVGSDTFSTRYLDYIPAREAKRPPYRDMGGEGMGLVAVSRDRKYSKSYMSAYGHGSEATDHFLVGRNEAGTYYAHAVPKTCRTVWSAVQWIWRGHADHIVRRQGDIALIRGRGKSTMPMSHELEGDGMIHHESHPAIPAPGPGQHIITARRAATHAVAETGD